MKRTARMREKGTVVRVKKLAASTIPWNGTAHPTTPTTTMTFSTP
jgi:hypothetical protein